MIDKRTCLCEHDLLWHGVGLGSNACKARTLKDASDMFGWPCHCQGFRTSIPGETMPEPDLLQMLWRLNLSLGRLETLLEAHLPITHDDVEEADR